MRLLEEVVGGRGVVGISLVEGESESRRVSVWKPSNLATEPHFLAYSITKTFIALLFLQMVEENRLQLEDRLANWFPEISNANEITLRQMLRHTAGIPDYGTIQSYHQDVRNTPETPWRFEQFLAETEKQGSLFPPGTGWAYSNIGFMLLKRIAEITCGRSLKDLVAELISKPLDLTNTIVVESIADLTTLAPATSSLLSPERELRDVRKHYHPGWVSHGVIASTPSEIAHFYSNLFAGHLLSTNSLTEMTTPVSVPNAPARWVNPCYGLGLIIDDRTPWGSVWGHGGGGPGYTSFALHVPDFPTGSRTICAMCGIEGDTLAEDLVFHLLEVS
ncbi:MAG: beta-lactamase family protein [Ignavibacteriae bacterium]|nr:beta-lactamase family protein [Ignavibacteriota bacterium]MCB9214550.1 beta-lactamase family protein [Ignavibacteria bacterium]